MGWLNLTTRVRMTTSLSSHPLTPPSSVHREKKSHPKPGAKNAIEVRDEEWRGDAEALPTYGRHDSPFLPCSDTGLGGGVFIPVYMHSEILVSGLTCHFARRGGK